MSAKDWNQAYIDGETPWDKGTAAPPLKDWLKRNAMEGAILALGSGVGHDVRYLANYSEQVTGLDLSSRATDLAQAYPLVNQERFICGDFFSPDLFEDIQFDWLYEHTFFCAIHPDLRMQYLDRILSLLKSNGELLGIFFLETEGHSENFTEGPPFKVSKDFLLKFFSPKFQILEAYVPTEHYSCRPYGSEFVLRLKLK